MLVKRPKGQLRSFVKKGFTTVIVLEALGFVGTYCLWYKANSDRDFRYYLHEKVPIALDYYYKCGEIIDSENRARQLDLQYWAAQGKKI